MFEKTNKILIKVFGSRNERLIKAYSVIALEAGEFEEQTKTLDDEALKAKTATECQQRKNTMFVPTIVGLIKRPNCCAYAAC